MTEIKKAIACDDHALVVFDNFLVVQSFREFLVMSEDCKATWTQWNTYFNCWGGKASAEYRIKIIVIIVNNNRVVGSDQLSG